VIRRFEVEAHQAEQRVQETFGLAKRHAEDDPRRQGGQDRQVRVQPLASTQTRFVEESVEPGSTVHSDGWQGYKPLAKKGYRHSIVLVSGRRKQASELLPRVHKAISLLKRWLLGTHQGAISHDHLDDYLDEFVFRFNRRSSRSRGKLFYRLVQQAVAVEPTPYRSIVADRHAGTL
jgi:transposase-like protein